jgi:hypothetical protein
VILLEGTTPEFFIDWWGASNLPSRLQFISYTANGLEAEGDENNVWNPTATNDHDTVDTNDFSTATHGASFWFGTNVCRDTDGVRLDTPSVEGQCGAFRAAQGCDVGSPGWTQWTPPRLTSIRRGSANVTLTWMAQPGSTNTVQYTKSVVSPPAATEWADLATTNFAGATCTCIDTTVGRDSQRFYRVQMISPAPCVCPP